MINDVSETWRAAAKAAVGGRDICVQGSTGGVSSLTGAGVVANGNFTSMAGATVVVGGVGGSATVTGTSGAVGSL